MITWSTKNPSWDYIVWTLEDFESRPRLIVGDSMTSSFVVSGPRIVLRNRALFDAFYDVYHAQADILRYEILYQYGGIYVDADSECLRPLDNSLRNDENFACRENDHDPPLLANSFLGAMPGSSLYGAVLEELGKLNVNAIANEEREVLSKAAWVLTGPACLSEVANRDGHKITIHPGYFFASHGEAGLYARHWLGSTNRTY